MQLYSSVPAQVVRWFFCISVCSIIQCKLASIFLLLEERSYVSKIRCPFSPCAATYVSMRDLAKHKRKCKYENRDIEASTCVLDTSASSVTTHKCQTDWRTPSFPTSVETKDIGWMGSQ